MLGSKDRTISCSYQSEINQMIFHMKYLYICFFLKVEFFEEQQSSL